MINRDIEKKILLGAALSEDELKLARAIYNTHVKLSYELDLEISIQSIIKLLNLPDAKESLRYIQKVFQEINEPLLVRNFHFRAKHYDMKFVTFCSYKIVGSLIEIALHEDFLEVEKNYMLDSFLTTQG